jgi:hypothetical protein
MKYCLNYLFNVLVALDRFCNAICSAMQVKHYQHAVGD